MNRPRCRPFSILDGMILIAGVATGIGLARIGPQEWSMSPWWRFRLFMLMIGPIPLLMVGPTLAFLVVRLRRPRPRLLWLVRQPGTAACLAIAVSLTVSALSWTLYGMGHDQGWIRTPEYTGRFWRMSHDPLGVSVLAAWLGLAISRRWRPEPGWIDRLGWGIGLFWILTILFEWQATRWFLTLWDLCFERTTR